VKICGQLHGTDVSSSGEKQELDDTLELQAAGALAERREQLISELIHEFTNTITAVIGYNELAIHTVEEFHPARQWVEKACKHTGQLAFLLNKLIDLKTPQHKRDPTNIALQRRAGPDSSQELQDYSWISKNAGTKCRL
jgi:signal transduction histidine kinase